MKQRGLAPILIVIILAIVVAILFVPIPIYQSGDASCFIGGNCSKQGWYLNGTLWQFLTSLPEKREKLESVITKTSDETATWKTYTSEILGLSMKYPTNIKFDHKQTFPGKEYLRFENDNGYMTLETMGCNIVYPNPVMEDTITTLGVTAKRYKIAPSGGYSQLVSNPKLKEGLCVNLTYGLKPESEKENKAIFDQILSTIQFTGQNQESDTSNWKTYTSNKFGYQIKHPEHLLVNTCAVTGIDEVDTLDIVLEDGKNRTQHCGTYIISVFIDSKTKKTIADKLDNFISRQVEAYGGKREDYAQIDTIIGGVSVTKLTSEINPFLTIYIFSKDSVIYYFYIQDNSGGKSQAEINQILSTFKFLDQ